MANAPKRSAAAAQAACDAMAALVNAGNLVIYGLGSGVPAGAATTITDQPVLATLALSATAFGAANAAGVATANTITAANATGNGTAAFFRLLANGATTAGIFQGTCGTASSDMILNTTTIVTGASVDITSLTLTESLG